MGIGSEIGSEISSGNQLAIVLGIASMNGLGNGSGIGFEELFWIGLRNGLPIALRLVWGMVWAMVQGLL